MSMDATSSNPIEKTFDVFLSFKRGKGHSYDVAKLLQETLGGCGMKVFMNNGKSVIKNNLSDGIVKAIEGSWCSIVVLSESYVSSRSCLIEFAGIMDHSNNTTHQVLPVCLRVKPWEILQDLEKSSFEYTDILPEFIEIKYTTYNQRTSSLSDEPSLPKPFGMSIKGKDMEKILDKFSHHNLKAQNRSIVSIKGIVMKKILDRLFHLKLKAQNRYLLEMANRLQAMDMLFTSAWNHLHNIVIVGMGGIGKTTIAEAFYDKYAHTFTMSCFLRMDGSDFVLLQQQQLLFQLHLTRDIQNSNEYGTISQIARNMSESESMLIVLDGINEKRQVELLTGMWYDRRITYIITTRRKNLFHDSIWHKGIVQEYNVELLSDTCAFSLFCKHAFQDDPPDDNFKDLCSIIIEKVGRHPLALCKIASSLYGQSIDMWKETLKSYPKLVYENVFFDTLKTSYEELEEESKEVFLDITCFFNGEKMDRVIEILEDFGYSSPHTKLRSLADRCLIDILDDEYIHMHNLILCMGQEIVHHEIPSHQGKQKQSRIWLREDAAHAFNEKYDSKFIQGIVLDLEEEEELVLEAKSFAYMTELKILQINNVQLSEEIEFLSNQLVSLNWPGYPSKCLPSTFQPPPLLELYMPGSSVEQLWNGRKKFENLKEIDIRDSKYLVETPDFSEVPNLRRLILQNCESLHEVHPSINSLEHLVLLDLEGCANFRRFSSDINCKRLKTLVLSNSGLEYFPEFGWRMKCLIELHIDGTFIYKLSPSITHLIGLVLLNLKDCTILSILPTEIGRLSSLQTLILNGCKNLDQIPQSLGIVKSLDELDIGGTLISHAPSVNPFLGNLRVLNCERLKSNIWHSLASLSKQFWFLKDLNLSDCNLVDEDIPKNLYLFSSLEILDLSSNPFVWLSNSLEQLVNLKVLYLNDCDEIKQLPSLPSSLQHVGGVALFEETSINSKGSSASTPSYLPYNPPVIPSIPSNKTLVEIENQVVKVCKLLDLERSNDILSVGIFGSAGIGKTSIVEVVYKEIADKFQSSCFLSISKENNLALLQNQMLSQLQLREVGILDEKLRVQVIKELLSSKKVLVVLDGVDEKSQIENVVGSPDWYTPGTRVIITSRNRDIFHQLNYKYNTQEYNVELLSHTSAYDLFCKHAFRDNLRDKDDLCHEIVKKLGRLPLALRTIGSSLHNKDFDLWEETLMELSKVEEDFINTILKRRRENLQELAI